MSFLRIPTYIEGIRSREGSGEEKWQSKIVIATKRPKRLFPQASNTKVLKAWMGVDMFLDMRQPLVDP